MSLSIYVLSHMCIKFYQASTWQVLKMHCLHFNLLAFSTDKIYPLPEQQTK